jgi:hypothetical protein
MIVHPQGAEPFCQRVGYSHSTNVIANTKEVQRRHEPIQGLSKNTGTVFRCGSA